MANVSRVLITPTLRFSYCNLLEARQVQKDGKPTGEKIFSLEGIIEPDNVKKFKAWDENANAFVDVDFAAVCAQLAREAWPGIDLKEEFRVGRNWPIHDGDKLSEKREAKKPGKAGNDVTKGMKVIKMKSKEEYPPRLWVPGQGGKGKIQLTQSLEADKGKIKNFFAAGNYGYCEITCRPSEVNDTKYITLYLNSVRYTKEGKRIGGQSMMDRFDGIQGGASEHDPTAGLDDEIPF